jgi:hypothetical protein
MAMVWAGSQVTKILRAGGWVIIQLSLQLVSWISDPQAHTFSNFKEYILPVEIHCSLSWKTIGLVYSRALAMAPFVDRGLRWFTVKFNFKSEGKVKYEVIPLLFFSSNPFKSHSECEQFLHTKRNGKVLGLITDLLIVLCNIYHCRHLRRL